MNTFNTRKRHMRPTPHTGVTLGLLAAMMVLGMTAPAGAASGSAHSGAFTYAGTWSGADAEHWSNTVGSTATVNVTVSTGGGTVSLWGYKAPNHGIAAVSLDNGTEVAVDLYRSSRSDQIVWTSASLSAGVHTLRVRVTGQKNAAASANFVSVTGVSTTNGTIGGTVTQPPAAPTIATTVTGVTDTSAVLNWDYTAGSSTITGIRVGRSGNDSTGSGPWSTTEAVADGSRQFNLLLPGTPYTLYAELLNGTTVVARSEKVLTTTGGTTTPPGNVPPVGPQFSLSFEENFNTPAPLGSFASTYSNWGTYDGTQPSDTAKKGVYDTGRTTSVANGILDQYVHTEAGYPRVSAVLVPIAGNNNNPWSGQLYGRYEVRFRIPQPIDGYKIAWLHWPASDDWADGEIDWPEATDLSTGRRARPAVKQLGNYNSTFLPPTEQFAPTPVSDGETWHTATTEWEPGVLRFYWDTTLVATVTDPAFVPWVPMRWVLQTETEIGGTTPSTAAGHLQIDWVRYYRYNG